MATEVEKELRAEHENRVWLRQELIRLARAVADQNDRSIAAYGDYDRWPGDSVNAMNVALDGLAAMGGRLRGSNDYIADLYAGRVEFG